MKLEQVIKALLNKPYICRRIHKSSWIGSVVVRDNNDQLSEGVYCPKCNSNRRVYFNNQMKTIKVQYK